MAQLTTGAGITFQDPMVYVEGDTRTPGWSGGFTYSRSVVTRSATPVLGGSQPDLAAGQGAIYDSGSVNHSLKFTVTADGGSSSPQSWAVYQVRMASPTGGSFSYGYRYQKSDTSYNFNADYIIRQNAGQNVYTSGSYSGTGNYEVRIVNGTFTVLKNGSAIFTRAVSDATLDSNTYCGISTSRQTVTQISVTPLDASGNPIVNPIPAFDYKSLTGSRALNPGSTFARTATAVTKTPLAPDVEFVYPATGAAIYLDPVTRVITALVVGVPGTAGLLDISGYLSGGFGDYLPLVKNDGGGKAIFQGTTGNAGWSVGRSITNIYFRTAGGSYIGVASGDLLMVDIASLQRTPLTDLLTGYHQGITATRTAASLITGQRSTSGITFRDPVNLLEVTTPPVTYDFGGVNARIQRQQKFSAQAVFFKDVGFKSVRTTAARFGASSFFESGRASVDVRTATSGAVLGTQAGVGSVGARVRTGAASVDLSVVLNVGATGVRTSSDKLGTDLLSFVDVGQAAKRTSGVPLTTPADLQYVYSIQVRSTAVGNHIAVLRVLVGGTYSFNALPDDPYVYYEFDSAITPGSYYNTTPADVGSQYPADGDPPVYLPAGSYILVVPDDYTDNYSDWASITGTRDGAAVVVTVGPQNHHSAALLNPPANDSLRSFIDLPGTSGSTTFSDIAATMQSGEPSLAYANNSAGSVWFRWEPDIRGNGHLISNPDVGIEAFTGPAPVYPVVGVNGYRGVWDSAATYGPGESVLYNGTYYTTSASTTHAPDFIPTYVDLMADAMVGGTYGYVTIPLGNRVLLTAGTYYSIQKNAHSLDYRNGTPLNIFGAVTPGAAHGYSYSLSNTWNTGSSYRSTVILNDTVDGVERGGFSGNQGTNYPGWGDHYDELIVTADIMIDSIKVWSVGYADELGTFGLASDPGTNPNGVVWATATTDPNPWTVVPDANPLAYDNLVPVGGGLGAADYDIRPGEIYYVRAYSLGEQSSTVPLAWSTSGLSLGISIVDSNLVNTPNFLGVSVVGASPSETVNYTIGSDSTVIGSSVVDEFGYASRTLVPVPALADGAYLLTATGVTSGRVGNAVFSVSSTEYFPPDPTDPPAPPAIIPTATPKPRWRFQDPTDQTYWDMPINPSHADSTMLPRNLTTHATTSFFGQPIVFEGARRGRVWTLTGHLFTLADVDQLRSWLRSYRIYIHDDFGRIFVVKVTGIQTVPIRGDFTHPEHHTYVITTLLYGKLPP